MKYFIDTEFIEGFHKPLFGKRRHFIDLISIGIVSEDGRCYSAISNEYRYNDADDWVKENVIAPLYISTVHGDNRNRCGVDTFHKAYGKPNQQIAEEICLFVYPTISGQFKKEGQEFLSRAKEYGWIAPQPEFYGYYADYDWVLFCSLFGRMIDLPKGFPMYCRDLKQMLDEAYIYQENKYPNEDRLYSWLRTVKNHPDYPKQDNEHNALSDAKWNRDLYYFIIQNKFLNNEASRISKLNS